MTIIFEGRPLLVKCVSRDDDMLLHVRTDTKTDGEYVEIIDRKEAIKYAIANGRPGDVIVLAGKGHEDYQEIKGVKYPMDERTLIEEVLQELGWK